MNHLSEDKSVLFALLTGSTLKHVLFWLLRNRNVKTYVGRVSEICVYPVKSARRIQQVSSALATEIGLSVDGVRDR